MKTLRNRNL